MPDSEVRKSGQCVVQYPWTKMGNVKDMQTKWQKYTRTTKEASTASLKSFNVQSFDADWITPTDLISVRETEPCIPTQAPTRKPETVVLQYQSSLLSKYE